VCKVEPGENTLGAYVPLENVKKKAHMMSWQEDVDYIPKEEKERKGYQAYIRKECGVNREKLNCVSDSAPVPTCGPLRCPSFHRREGGGLRDEEKMKVQHRKTRGPLQ